MYSDFGNFRVTTIYRQSSAMGDDSWYYETFGWTLTPEYKLDKIIADNSGTRFPERAIKQHMAVVEALMQTGKFESHD